MSQKGNVRAFGEREKKNKKESIQLALVKGQEEGQVEHQGLRAFRCFNQLKALSSPVHSERCPSAMVESRPVDTVVTTVLQTGFLGSSNTDHTPKALSLGHLAAHKHNCGHDWTHSRECHAFERPKCRTLLQQKLT